MDARPNFEDVDELWLHPVDLDEQNRLLDDVDRISFEDSERFEEESSSWQSIESLNIAQQNWRGWTGDVNRGGAEEEIDNQPGPSNRLLAVSGRHSAASSTHTLTRPHSSHHQRGAQIGSLRSFAAEACAQHLSFESIQEKYQTLFMENLDNPMSIYKTNMLPEDYFMEIVQYCFPKSEEDVRLYSCLANRNGDEFVSGETLLKENLVHDVLQIGFHLSGLVRGKAILDEQTGKMGISHNKDEHRVSAKIDRCRIVELECSCDLKSQWCQHAVALCLYRMQKIDRVEFRPPLIEAISEMKADKLRVFISYLLDKLPRQYLPTAQILLDELGKVSDEEINTHTLIDSSVPAHCERAIWVFNEDVLRENVRRSINKFCIPSPQVHCDVESMSSPQTAVSFEFSSLHRSFRSREPEALWNLLSIVREMYRRRDENATTLLHIITEQCLMSEPMLIWWYMAKLAQTGRWTFHGSVKSANSVINTTARLQYNCSTLFDEIVRLWRCAALNPLLTTQEKNALTTYLQSSHRMACENIWKALPKYHPENPFPQHHALVCWVCDEKGEKLKPEAAHFSRDSFPGFFCALEACQVSWDNCLINGVDVFHHLSSEHCSTSLPIDGIEEAEENFPSLPFLHKKRSPTLHSPFPQGPSPFGSHLQSYDCHVFPEKKKKKKKRPLGGAMGRRGHQVFLPEFFDHRSLRRATREAARRAARLVQAGQQDGGDESTESGQESDLPQNLPAFHPPRDQAGSSGQIHLPNNTEFPNGDIDLLLASAHESVEGLELKFARCEALHVHGYEKEGFASALELMQFLRASPPDLSLPSSLINHLVKQSERGKRMDESSNWDIKKWKKPIRNGRNEMILNQLISPLVTDAKLLATSERTIKTFERAAFLAKIFVSDSSLHSKLFNFLLFVLELPQTPMANKYLQVKLFHLEAYLLSVLRGIEITQCELGMVRERAAKLCNRISRPSLFSPSIALCHFIFDSLSYTTNMYPNGNHSPASSAAKNIGRLPTDDVISLKIALDALGSRQIFSEDDCPMLTETVRRQKGCLASTLMIGYKDSNEMLGHVLDRLLDPRMHLMYNEMRHQSNACYFLEQDPSYKKYCQKGARPHYPYRPEELEILVAETTQAASAPAFVSRSASCQSAESTGELPSGSEGPEGQSADDETEQMTRGLSNLSALPSNLTQSTVERQSEQSTSESTDRNSPQASTCSSTAPPSVGRSSVSSLCAEPIDTDDSACISMELFKKRSKWNALYAYGSERPSEAVGHHYLEFAKKIMAEAGGPQAQSREHWNNQPNPNVQQQGVNRKLQIAAFLIGLYALGLNNLVNSTWPTRTYSQHVSWLKTQIDEIGGAAIEILRSTWRKHLVPGEVADIILQPGYSRDAATVTQAAHLAVDALHSADAISTQNCTQLLLHCKEQSPALLEQACRAIEKASGTGDGVAPEILFIVAKYWHELYKENDAASAASTSQQQPQQQLPPSPQIVAPQMMPQQFHQRPPQRQPHFHSSHMNYMRPNAYDPQLPFGFHPSMPPPAPPQQHFMGQGTPHHSPRPHTMYLHPQQFQPYPMMMVPNGGVDPSVRGPPPSIHQSHSAPSLLPGQIPQQNDPSIHPISQQFIPYSSHHYNMPSEVVFEKLLLAYNVGMKALETMGKREQDDRQYMKYSENPGMKEDIMWLHRVASDLDQFIRSQQPAAYSIDFYRMAIQCVASPFILFELAERSTELRGLMGGAQSGLIYPPRSIHPINHNRVKYVNPPGSIRQAFNSIGFPFVIGELIEEALEAFYTALACKVTHPRLGASEKNDANNLVLKAAKCIQWIPVQPLRQQNHEAFVRHIMASIKSRDKELRNELLQAMNTQFS
ncbi:unnamed protein product, partial [Mesorhabditis belari]|uniref:SWIM-type domain-containing protein n=1 Tax=Mesorhabditis belari TaxID=2138241 RepID=A0AAF3FRN6_9BILA